MDVVSGPTFFVNLCHYMRYSFVLYFMFILSVCFSQSNSQVDSLVKLMKQFRKTDVNASFQYAQRALELSNKNNLHEKVVELNNSMGMMCAQKGEYTSALNYFNESLNQAKKIFKQDFVAKANVNIANIYLSQGKYNSALDKYLDALKIVEKGTDKDVLYVNYLCIGITYYYLKNYPKSLEFYEKCLAMEKEKGSTAKMAYTYNAMGIIYKELADHAKAMDYLERAQKIALQSGDSIILSHNMASLGELYGIKGDPEKAKAFLESGLGMQRHFKDDKGIGQTLVHLGDLALKVHQPERSVEHYTEALEVGKRVGVNEIIKDAYKGLSNAYVQLHDPVRSLEYHKAFSEVKDSLFNSTSSMQIADMQTKYETDKKEQENMLLVKDNNIKNVEIDKQKTLRNSIVVVLIMTVLLGLLLYNSNRLKHKNKFLAERELRHLEVFQAQEKEKMHLSKELHDGLGPLLSLIKLNVSTLEVNPGNERAISEVKELTSESIKEVRNISHALAPSLLQKQGLQAALTDFIDQVNASGGLHVQLDLKLPDNLSAEVEINLYRIVQEAMNNTMKHSGATNASVTVQEKKAFIELAIKDNGSGFSNSNKESSGNGLNNIYSRVDFLKGQITCSSEKGRGAEFLILIPLNKKEHA